MLDEIRAKNSFLGVGFNTLFVPYGIHRRDDDNSPYALSILPARIIMPASTSAPLASNDRLGSSPYNRRKTIAASSCIPAGAQTINSGSSSGVSNKKNAQTELKWGWGTS